MTGGKGGNMPPKLFFFFFFLNFHQKFLNAMRPSVPGFRCGDLKKKFKNMMGAGGFLGEENRQSFGKR